MRVNELHLFYRTNKNELAKQTSSFLANSPVNTEQSICRKLNHNSLTTKESATCNQAVHIKCSMHILHFNSFGPCFPLLTNFLYFANEQMLTIE